MSGILSSLSASASTLETFSRELEVTQNNVSNASTPGYAEQVAQVTPLPFDAISGSAGGVHFSGSISLRNESAERFVQQQNSDLGNAQAQVNSLSALQPSLDITGQSGLDAAFTKFFNGFSALTQDPNSVPAREQVLIAAQNVASAFNDVASATGQAAGEADRQIGTTVNQINTIASQLQQYNLQRQLNAAPDPNLDASVHANLENLASLVNFTTSFAADGTVTVLVGGQTPLVLGAQDYPLQSVLSPAGPTPPNAFGNPARAILDAGGSAITSQVTGGQLAGLLQVRNGDLASIQGDTAQVGSLNELAQSFTARVNALLTSGQISTGPPPLPGQPLFQITSGDPTAAAHSMATTAITPQQIATISPGPPESANGIAQNIANLPTSTNPADQLNGLTFTNFYASIATQFGQQLSLANTLQGQKMQSLAQAQSLRGQSSGVSLDQEAVNLTGFQRAYEATSKLVTVLSSLTETTINLIP